jgi:hypothetical protein
VACGGLPALYGVVVVLKVGSVAVK